MFCNLISCVIYWNVWAWLVEQCLTTDTNAIRTESSLGLHLICIELLDAELPNTRNSPTSFNGTVWSNCLEAIVKADEIEKCLQPMNLVSDKGQLKK